MKGDHALVRAVGPAILALLAACASAGARYDDGQRAFAAGSWQAAREDLEDFLQQNDCGTSSTDPRCDEARVAIAECHLRLGSPEKAFFALQRVRDRESRDQRLIASIDRIERDAQSTLTARFPQRPSGQGSLIVRFQSDQRKPLHLRKVNFFLDLQPLPTDNRAPYVEGTKVLVVPPTDVAPGRHELEVSAVFEGIPPYGGYVFWTQGHQPFEVGPSQPTELDVHLIDVHAPYLVDTFKLDVVERAHAPTAPSK